MNEIKLTLIDESTRGRWSAQMGNLIAFRVPRDLLASDLSSGMGLFFLFSDKAVYVGGSADVVDRIRHLHKFDGWTEAVLILSTNSSFNEKTTNYLWAELCKLAVQGTYKIVNDVIPAQPILPTDIRDNLNTIAHMMGVLLYALGRDLFDVKVNATPPPPPPPPVDLFYINKNGGANATGCWEQGSITVLEGSEIRHNVTTDCSMSIRQKRQELIDSGVIKNNIFTRNHYFRTPSAAAVVILGCSANGWDEWKTKGGITLKALKK